MNIEPLKVSRVQGNTPASSTCTSGKVSAFLKQMIADGKLTPGSVQGCSPAEIEAIEKSFGTPLPSEYKDFLQLIGKSAGNLFRGSTMHYHDLRNLLELQEDAQALLESNEFSPLPKTAFVFFMHQGYTFSYFLLNDGDDPAVYQFCEGQKSTTFDKPWNTFSEFLKNFIGQ